MKRRFIGIDFRPQGIAAVVATGSLKGLWIETAQYLPRLAGSALDDQLKAFLSEMLPPGERENLWTAISLPASQMAFRNLQAPFKELKKIRQILPFELEPSLPEGIEDLVFDFIPVQMATGQMHILAGTIDKSHLEAYRRPLADVGLTPQVITVGGYVLSQQLNQTQSGNEDSLLISADGRIVTLVISAAKQVASLRAFTLPASLSSALSFSSASVRQTLSAFKENWLPEYSPQKVLLSGSNSEMFSQQGTISRNLGLPVEPVDTEQIAQIAGADPAGEGWREQVFANALSLVAQQGKRELGLNFRQDTFTLGKFWDDNRPAFIKTGIAALVVLGLALFTFLYEISSLKGAVASYDKEIHQLFRSSFPEITTIVDPVHQMGVKISELESQARLPLEAGRGLRSIDLLNTISQQIDPKTDVEISRLVVGSDGIMLTGNTDSFNSVDEIKSQLEQSQLIQEVSTASANKQKRGNRIQFKLKIALGEITTS
jgi:type II secretion system protein L